MNQEGRWWFSRQVVSDSCGPMDGSPPGSSVPGILQARILEWVAISFSRGLPNPGIEPRSPALQADFLLTELCEKPRENGKKLGSMSGEGPGLEERCSLKNRCL